MDQNILFLLIVVALVAIGILVWMTMRKKHTDQLRGKFGDEYDRTLEAQGDRAAAEAALEERQERVDNLDIRRLTADEHSRFADEWHEVKSVFVDSPTEAVLHADRMLATMMKTVGYPMADFDRRFEDLTVNHRDVAQHYRAGHDIAERHNSGNASTEDMRQAMKHYEALYDHLAVDTEHDTNAANTGGATPATTMTDTGVSRPVTTKATDLDGDSDVDIVRQDVDGDGQTDRVTTNRN
ncbi:MAG: hypothetical protein WBA68_00535 [Alteraurantiacibacter sp.]